MPGDGWRAMRDWKEVGATRWMDAMDWTNDFVRKRKKGLVFILRIHYILGYSPERRIKVGLRKKSTAFFEL